MSRRESGPSAGRGEGESGNDGRGLSRRAVLRRTGIASTVLATGSGAVATGTARGHGEEGDSDADYCAQTTTEPRMVAFDDDGMAACDADHQASKSLQTDVATALDERFPTVGAMIEDGYVPYFDFATAPDGDDVSHWINPEYLGDDGVIDPRRPESIMVDHHWWRPLGVMFIATRDGEEVDPPPAVYRSDDGDACLPWHTHVGLPGRKSWWKYRATRVDAVAAVREGVPCRTPWMMHVWAFDHPEGVYAEGSLPRGSRGGPPAEPAGFETDAVPGEDDLDAEALLDAGNEELREWVEGLDDRIDAAVDETKARIAEGLDEIEDGIEGGIDDAAGGVDDLSESLDDLL